MKDTHSPTHMYTLTAWLAAGCGRLPQVENCLALPVARVALEMERLPWKENVIREREREKEGRLE